MKLLSTWIKFLRLELLKSKSFSVLSNLESGPAKVGRWESRFLYHTPSVEGDLRMIKLS